LFSTFSSGHVERQQFVFERRRTWFAFCRMGPAIAKLGGKISL
jgi:hypothetical protein